MSPQALLPALLATSPSPPPASKRARAAGPAPAAAAPQPAQPGSGRGAAALARRRPLEPPTCRVAGCAHTPATLSDWTSFCTRTRMCPVHQRAVSFSYPGVDGDLRFCQKCCKAQTVADFDGTNRTCRAKLAAYNARRREMALAAAAARAGHNHSTTAPSAAENDSGEASAAAPGTAASAGDVGSRAGGGSAGGGGGGAAAAPAPPPAAAPPPADKQGSSGGDGCGCGAAWCFGSSSHDDGGDNLLDWGAAAPPRHGDASPSAVPLVTSLKLSYATPIQLPPGLPAALHAARALLAGAPPLALAGSPIPGCTLLIIDTFAERRSSGESGGGESEGETHPRSGAAAAALRRLLSAPGPVAAFLRAQPRVTLTHGSAGGAAMSSFGVVAADEEAGQRRNNDGGSTDSPLPQAPPPARIPPLDRLAVLLPPAAGCGGGGGAQNGCIRFADGSPLPPSLRVRLHGQWLAVQACRGGGGGAAAEAALPPLPAAAQGVAFVDDGAAPLAQPRPLLLLRSAACVEEIERSAAEVAAAEAAAAAAAEVAAVEAAAEAAGRGGDAAPPRRHHAPPPPHRDPTRSELEAAACAIGWAVQPRACAPLLLEAVRHAIHLRWRACAADALQRLAAELAWQLADGGDDDAAALAVSGNGSRWSLLHAAAASGCPVLVGAVMGARAAVAAAARGAPHAAAAAAVVFGSPYDASADPRRRTPLHLAAAHADGLAVAAFEADGGGDVPIAWCRVRDVSGATPARVASHTLRHASAAAAAPPRGLAEVDARLRSTEAAATAAARAALARLRREGWLLRSMRIAEAISAVSADAALDARVKAAACALLRAKAAACDAVAATPAGRPAAGASAVHDTAAVLGEEYEDDEDAFDEDDFPPAALLSPPPLLHRLGFTQRYAAFVRHAAAASAPQVALERCLLTLVALSAWRRACPDGCPPGSPRLAPIAALQPGGGRLSAAAIRSIYHVHLDVAGVASLSAAVIAFVMWPRLLQRFAPLPPPAEGEAAAAAAARAGGRGAIAAASARARRARFLATHARLYGPVLAIAWLHTYLGMMVSMELHVRRRLPPGSPPLLVPPLRVAMMLCGAASCSRAYPLGLLLVIRAAVCALPALCASRLGCGGLLSRLVVPVFAYAPVLGFDHGWVAHFALAAAAAARVARSERRAFWAWAGAEAGDAPTNAEALATVVSEIGDAMRAALAGMASRARAAASRLSAVVSRRVGDSGGGGQAFGAYAYGDKSTLLAYAASPAATTAVIFIKDACTQLAHRPTGGGGAAPPPPAAPAGGGAPPILTRDQTIRLYAAAPLFPAIAVLASLVPLLMAVSPPWVRGRAFLAANRDAVLFLSASVRFTLATVASYRSLASSLGVAPVIASSNLPYSVVNTGIIALVPASAAARTAILLLRLTVVAIPPPIVAWPQYDLGYAASLALCCASTAAAIAWCRASERKALRQWRARASVAKAA